MDEKIPWLKQLYAELERKYRRVLVLTRKIQDLCANETFPLEDAHQEKLTELLAGREKLIKEAATGLKEALALEQGLQKLHDRDQLPVARAPEHGFSSLPDQFSAASHRLEHLLGEITALDAVSGQILESLLQHAAGEIKKIQKGKKANEAYRDHGYQFEGFFVDSSK